MASSTRYGMRSSSSVWPAAGGRSSAVGCMLVDGRQRGDRSAGPSAPSVSSQRSQSKQKRLVDAGDRAQTAAGIAVHRGIAHGRLAAVAGREQQGVLHVGQQPHARRTDPGLDVLEGNVVGLPGERSAKYLLDAGNVALDQPVDLQARHFGPQGLGQRRGRLACGAAAVAGCLVDAVQQAAHPVWIAFACRPGR